MHRSWILFLAIFVATFAAFYLSPARQSNDSAPVIPTAISIIQGDAGDISKFKNSLARFGYYQIDPTAKGVRSLFPIGPSMLAVPFVAVALAIDPSIEAFAQEHIAIELEALVASFVCALAGAIFFFFIAREFRSKSLALFATFVLCFGTSVWSTASRGLWQHGPLILMIVSALWLISKAKDDERYASLVAVPLALAFIMRPLAAIPIVFISAYILFFYPRRVIWFAFLAALVATPWLAFNIFAFGKPFPDYYLPSRLAQTRTFSEALAGNIISPARGLFIYSPILILSLAGVACGFNQRRMLRDRFLIVSAASISLCHLVLISRFPHWWGGGSVGPRFMSDVLPFLVYLMCFTIVTIKNLKNALANTAIGTAAAVGFLMNANAAISDGPFNWNVSPNSIDHHPNRIWSWSDPPFLRPYAAPTTERLLPDVGPLYLKIDAEPTKVSSGSISRTRLTRGWYEPEKWGTWGIAPTSVLLISSDPPEMPLRMILTGHALTGPSYPEQTIEVGLNDQKLADWTFRTNDSSVLSIALPNGIQSSSKLSFTIRSPKSPREMGIGQDDRLLNIGISSIALQSLAPN